MFYDVLANTLRAIYDMVQNFYVTCKFNRMCEKHDKIFFELLASKNYGRISNDKILSKMLLLSSESIKERDTRFLLYKIPFTCISLLCNVLVVF